MVSNIPVFSFIYGAPYLPALGNTTIAVIIFWRKKIRALIWRLKDNLEERKEVVVEEEDNIERDVEVYRDLDHPCIHHLLNKSDWFSDFTSLLAYPSDWNLFFTMDKGIFIRITINYFKMKGQWDFANSLYTLLSLHFMDKHLI